MPCHGFLLRVGQPVRPADSQRLGFLEPCVKGLDPQTSILTEVLFTGQWALTGKAFFCLSFHSPAPVLPDCS